MVPAQLNWCVVYLSFLGSFLLYWIELLREIRRVTEKMDTFICSFLMSLVNRENPEEWKRHLCLFSSHLLYRNPHQVGSHCMRRKWKEKASKGSRQIRFVTSEEKMSRSQREGGEGGCRMQGKGFGWTLVFIKDCDEGLITCLLMEWARVIAALLTWGTSS